ncbi:CDP-alcohol phosphatidyltransferase family protein [Luteimonas sp. MJ250]|uniref:CDP-alcohol phosphatidyltransferase family protein n=1 Tax=Luteimonas sp. MJ250 TaxID=3129236 RepID=UPI0031BAAE04
MSIYLLKGRFQGLLRPGVRLLARIGVTANQVTLAAAALSLLVAWVVFSAAPARPLLYLLLPMWMLLRMALNAVDGMLAREFGQQSPLGAYLNELCDVVADAALYLCLLAVPGIQTHLFWAMVLLALLTEYAGVLGLMVGGGRRYEGPMGKSDRAFVVGLIGVLLAMEWIGGSAVNIAVAIMAALCLPTIGRRINAGMREAREASLAHGE